MRQMCANPDCHLTVQVQVGPSLCARCAKIIDDHNKEVTRKYYDTHPPIKE